MRGYIFQMFCRRFPDIFQMFSRYFRYFFETFSIYLLYFHRFYTHISIWRAIHTTELGADWCQPGSTWLHFSHVGVSLRSLLQTTRQYAVGLYIINHRKTTGNHRKTKGKPWGTIVIDWDLHRYITFIKLSYLSYIYHYLPPKILMPPSSRQLSYLRCLIRSSFAKPASGCRGSWRGSAWYPPFISREPPDQLRMSRATLRDHL